MSMLYRHQKVLKAKMGCEAYEARRQSKIRIDMVPASRGTASGPGRSGSRSKLPDSKPSLNKIQKGVVTKTSAFKPVKFKMLPTPPSSPVEFKAEEDSKIHSISLSKKPKSYIEPDFITKLEPSAHNTVPRRSSLKKKKSSALWSFEHPDPAPKTVRFVEGHSTKFVRDLAKEQPDYYFKHGVDSYCYCRKCRKDGPKDPSNNSNNTSLEVLSMRIRGDLSMYEDTLDVDKALLLARFNKHRMLGEALQGPHKYFLADLYLSKKNKAALSLYHQTYDAEENALELMRHKRRKNAFFKISQREWEWLDIDELAPEIRSSEPRTELDLHWELIEDSEMMGFDLNTCSNIKRTMIERTVAEGTQLEESMHPAHLHPAHLYPKITVPEEAIPPVVDFQDHFRGEAKFGEQPEIRPQASNLWT